MMYFMSVDSVVKELRLHGKLSARSLVPPDRYDVTAGDQPYRGLFVAEPHVNTSALHRVLTVQCHVEAFELEAFIQRFLDKKKTSRIDFHKAHDFRAAEEGRVEFLHPSDSFHMIVSIMFKYVTIRGCLRSPKETEPDATLVARNELLMIEAKSKSEVTAKFANENPPARLRLTDTHVEVYFSDKGNVADAIAKSLNQGIKCRIPILAEGSWLATGEQCSE